MAGSGVLLSLSHCQPWTLFSCSKSIIEIFSLPSASFLPQAKHYPLFSPHLDRVSIALADIVSVCGCHCCTRIPKIKKRKTIEFCPCIRKRNHSTSNVVKIFYATQNAKNEFQMEMLVLSCGGGGGKSPTTATVEKQQMLTAIAFKIQTILDGKTMVCLNQTTEKNLNRKFLGFDRPKRLLMFVNPFGGSKNGKKIFDEKVKPMLELGGVLYTTIVTERANHAMEILLNENTDLHEFDGIVCVGGDGMFGEVLNGVLIRVQRENRIDYGSVESIPKRPTLKLGVIPAGSTDAIVYATCGSKNPTNSIISILLGRKINIDVGAIHDIDGKRLIRYSASFMGYGFMGDTIHDAEQNRWMGPKRYDWAGLKKFFKHRLYSGEIKLCIEPKDGSPKDFNPCKSK